MSAARQRVKYWEIIADNLSKAGWSWGCVSAIDSSGRTIFVADAHRGDGKRFVVCADEKLTAFVELEAAIQAEASARSLRSLKHIVLLVARFRQFRSDELLEARIIPERIEHGIEPEQCGVSGEGSALLFWRLRGNNFLKARIAAERVPDRIEPKKCGRNSYRWRKADSVGLKIGGL
jgi:hypothetical protein